MVPLVNNLKTIKNNLHCFPNCPPFFRVTISIQSSLSAGGRSIPVVYIRQIWASKAWQCARLHEGYCLKSLSPNSPRKSVHSLEAREGALRERFPCGAVWQFSEIYLFISLVRKTWFLLYIHHISWRGGSWQHSAISPIDVQRPRGKTAHAVMMCSNIWQLSTSQHQPLFINRFQKIIIAKGSCMGESGIKTSISGTEWNVLIV